MIIKTHQWIAINVIDLYCCSQIVKFNSKAAIRSDSSVQHCYQGRTAILPSLLCSTPVAMWTYWSTLYRWSRVSNPIKIISEKCHMWFWARDGWRGQRVCVSGSNHCCRGTNWSCLFVRPHTVMRSFWQMLWTLTLRQGCQTGLDRAMINNKWLSRLSSRSVCLSNSRFV